jgi:hypothetical protein
MAITNLEALTADHAITPAGKKTLRRSKTGNLMGYVSGKFWMNFGDYFDHQAQTAANEWKAEKH